MSQEKLAVKVGLVAPNAAYWPIYTAIDGGYAAKYGLDVTLTQLASTLLVPALLNNEVDAIDLAAGAFVPAVIGGADVRLVTSDSNVSVFGFVAGKEIQQIKDLKGKVVAISGRGQSDDFLDRRIFTMNGLQPDRDVTFIPSGGTPQSFAILQSGHAAGAMMTPPTLFQALDMGFHLVVRPADLFPYLGSGMVMRSAKLATPQGEEIARRIAHAHVDAIQRIKSDKSFATQVLTKRVDGTTADAAAKTWDWAVPGIPQDGYPTREGLQLVIEDLKDLYKDKPAPTVDSLLDLKYLDEVKAEATR